jgi:hypothetical protein
MGSGYDELIYDALIQISDNLHELGKMLHEFIRLYNIDLQSRGITNK